MAKCTITIEDNEAEGAGQIKVSMAFDPALDNTEGATATPAQHYAFNVMQRANGDADEANGDEE